MSYLLKIKNATFRKFQYTVFQDTDWEMQAGENWMIVGDSGSGKTTFLEILEGRVLKTKGEVICNFTGADAGNPPYFAGNPPYFVGNPPCSAGNPPYSAGNPPCFAGNPSGHVASVYFNDPSLNYGDFYYQQRYNASETDNVVTVRNFLKLNDANGFPELQALGVAHLLDTEIIKLSNGQFKKMLIVKALMKKPRLLLLDNLYTGLDRQARDYITHTVREITSLGTNVVIVADDRHIPDSISNVMEIENFSIKRTSNRKDYIPVRCHRQAGLPVLPPAPEKTFETAVRLDGVNIVYSNKPVVNQVKWTINHGDKWALTGPNGAGKTMLLSLIFADNPQAYSNSIILFDRKRGTGESIWDIKDKIGFVSPEMHLYFNRNKTCREIALSALSENPYRKIRVTDEIEELADNLFDYFSIAKICRDLFQHVSTGQQNIVLLIRALIKNPPVLALDEPFQGMDCVSVDSAKYLLDEYCHNRTLIFVSHQPEEFPSCIDKYFCIENGKCVNVNKK
ncbi:MAG: ATP-binding cassette domain-containing protein [Prevotellaceae bacterium]|jgi:molybdate transport system ATP-binding protein|nr:ATP-binding cassette domain-containing protein [Prevotellaceae bacterium]